MVWIVTHAFIWVWVVTRVVRSVRLLYYCRVILKIAGLIRLYCRHKRR